ARGQQPHRHRHRDHRRGRHPDPERADGRRDRHRDRDRDAHRHRDRHRGGDAHPAPGRLGDRPPRRRPRPPRPPPPPPRLPATPSLQALDATGSPASGLSRFGLAFAIDVRAADGTPITTFDRPLTIVVSYTDADVANWVEGSLTLAFQAGDGSWVVVPATL